MPELRPIPADFAEMAYKFERSTSRLQGHYTAGQATVARWMKEAGIPMLGSNKRPVPNDFAEVAPTMLQSKLAKHYRTSESAVKRWIEETGVTPLKGHPCKYKAAPCPSDFAEVAPTMGIVALSKHYGISHKTIKRWLQETGTQPKRYDPSENRPRSRKSVATVRHILPREIVKTRTRTIYEDAADTLRRERFPVNRCNEKGGFDPKGKFWRVGWSVLTGDELLERAARYRRAA